jgi:hypothetical protein
MTSRYYGRLPNSGKPRVRLHRAHLAVPHYQAPLAPVDNYSRLPAALWGMDDNDRLGCCTVADVDHEIKSMDDYAGSLTFPQTTNAEIDTVYELFGYNPADPATDQGAEMQAVRAAWRKTGFVFGGIRDQIALFAELDVADVGLIQTALREFGAIGLGINCPKSAEDQFDAGKDWVAVNPDGGIVGGHAIALVGFDTNWLYVLTWGRVQRMSYSFWARYGEEVWVSLSQDYVDSTAGTAKGQRLYGLGAQFFLLTGQSNPFPAPVTPQPTPPPAPVPGRTTVDAEFAADLHLWLRERHVLENHKLALAAKKWLIAMDL